VAPALPPSTTMPPPSVYIEDAADGAAAMVKEKQRSSRVSEAVNGGVAVDGDEGDISSDASRGSRARRRRAGVTGYRPFLLPSVHAASARGRSTMAGTKQLLLGRARASGLNIDECIVNGMGWGSSSNGYKDNKDNGEEEA